MKKYMCVVLAMVSLVLGLGCEHTYVISNKDMTQHELENVLREVDYSFEGLAKRLKLPEDFRYKIVPNCGPTTPVFEYEIANGRFLIVETDEHMNLVIKAYFALPSRAIPPTVTIPPHVPDTPADTILAAQAAELPVRADYLWTQGGKPPMRAYSVRLTLVNQHDWPVWFVLPYYGDMPLPENGVFTNVGWKDQPFEGRKFEGEGGSVIQVTMFGGKGFKALRLPAKGQLDLDGYRIEAWKEINEIMVLEARELTVNGKIPLDKWLPYDTMSGEKVTVCDEAIIFQFKILHGEAKKPGDRDGYPKEKVEEVKAEGFRSWTVKFQHKGVNH